MAFELLFWPEADEALRQLERDPPAGPVHRAIDHTLDRLELFPGDPRLGTRQFSSLTLGHIRATPANEGDWYILWVPGVDRDTIEIVQIADVAL